jgi:hypothetical protein
MEEAPNLRGAGRYPLLLALVLIDVVLPFVLPANAWGTLVSTPVVAATLVIGLVTAGAPRRVTIAALTAGACITLFAVLEVALDTTRLQGVGFFLLAAMLLVTPPLILRRIFAERRVTLRILFGAVSVYVLIGLTFAYLFVGVHRATGSFFTQSGSHSPADFVYFSFITMTTVGYGDLTPATGLARVLSLLEAMLGQVFLVTAVALLVSLYGQHTRGPDEG